jgi:hypothetical protein
MREGIEELQAELASMAMDVARLLTGEPYDEAELAELDRQRRELRRRSTKPRRQPEAHARTLRASGADGNDKPTDKRVLHDDVRSGSDAPGDNPR